MKIKLHFLQLKSYFILSFLLLGILFFSCKKEKINTESCSPLPDLCDIISFKMNGALCALDKDSKTFFYPIKENEQEFSPFIEIIHEDLEIFISGNLISNFDINNLGLVNIAESLPIEFITCDGRQLDYQIIFTRLPVIQIQTNDKEIVNTPKIPVDFYINDPDYLEHGLSKRELSLIAGVELRGGSALFYPKNSYAVELWSDNIPTEKIDTTLLGMRSDDDWILDAMYIDKARMRNRVSTDIWLDFHRLHYQDLKPNAKSGTHGTFVEVFLNDSYHGLYAFTERVDRKLLKLQKFENEDEHGLLYKSVSWENGVVWFQNYFDFDPLSGYWQGWEQKHPDVESEGIFWEPLASFTQFVVESSDDDFTDQITEKLHLDNAVDYFIFLNLIRGNDNTGKNIFMAKLNQTDRFFMLPWDMDGTWGRSWDGNTTWSEGYLTNNLFDRLIENDVDNFRNKLKQRWTTARNNIFTTNNIMSYFERYAEILEQTKAFERDKMKWEMNNTLTDELDYTRNWIESRLGFLDGYFDML